VNEHEQSVRLIVLLALPVPFSIRVFTGDSYETATDCSLTWVDVGLTNLDGNKLQACALPQAPIQHLKQRLQLSLEHEKRDDKSGRPNQSR
jgi:hypothetical protein